MEGDSISPEKTAHPALINGLNVSPPAPNASSPPSYASKASAGLVDRASTFLVEDPAALVLISRSSTTIRSIHDVLNPITSSPLSTVADLHTAKISGIEMVLWRITPAGPIAQCIEYVNRVTRHFATEKRPDDWFFIAPWVSSLARAVISYPLSAHLINIEKTFTDLVHAAYPDAPFDLVSVTPVMEIGIFTGRIIIVIRPHSPRLPRATKKDLPNGWGASFRWAWALPSNPATAKAFSNGWEMCRLFKEQKAQQASSPSVSPSCTPGSNGPSVLYAPL